jgi:phosphonopyruvate decarboxylase
VPMLLLIGWRGEVTPNGEQLRDEPQHMLQGFTTEKLLESVHITYEVGDNLDGCVDAISRLHAKASNDLTPTALLIRKGVFKEVSALQAISETAEFPSRASYIRLIADVLPKNVALVATTGKISRELEVATRISGGGQTLLVVGGMGHALAITAGIATASSKKVLCLDGDGAFLMHLGTGFVAAEHSNLIHVVLNNGCHESVGGQPTVAKNRTLRRLGQAMGYSFSTSVKTLEEFQVAIRKALDIRSSSFIEVRCSVEDSNSLPRPIQAPLQNRKNFMDFLGNG